MLPWEAPRGAISALWSRLGISEVALELDLLCEEFLCHISPSDPRGAKCLSAFFLYVAIRSDTRESPTFLSH